MARLLVQLLLLLGVGRHSFQPRLPGVLSSGPVREPFVGNERALHLLRGEID
jgi:hypothetical protein